mmetsp:Transcript_104343/g.294194  ORF Transcript_104343/g.294194 Transcript_104343/m.294194 type:complete len:499 (+) Transcript_104343:126-1622(+)
MPKRCLQEVEQGECAGGVKRRPSIDVRRDSVPCGTDPPACARLQLDSPVLRLKEALATSYGVDKELLFRFQSTRACRVRRIDSLADFHALLAEQVTIASETQEKWLRQPHTEWITQMIGDLTLAQHKRLVRRHRILQSTTMPDHDVIGRWGETSEFATAVVNLWFENKSLAEVLERAQALGHMDEQLSAGCILEGEFIDSLSMASDFSFEHLVPMVRKLTSREAEISVYQVCRHNCFEQEQRHKRKVSELKPNDGQGSLNTTWTYDGKHDSGVGMLDDFFASMIEVIDPCEAVLLNRRMYVIWKFQHYVTSYHQDTHVPPHITLYNQVSGPSLFHFLPMLVGLYVTHVGRKDVRELNSVLGQLDSQGIGTLAAIGPGQVAFITPFGSHGVWVPAAAYNPTLPPFQVSLIRAAELYVAPLFRSARERLTKRKWNHVLADTPEEVAQLRKFMAVQDGLCREMNITREEWLSLVRQTWDAWDDPPSEEEEEEEEMDFDLFG